MKRLTALCLIAFTTAGFSKDKDKEKPKAKGPAKLDSVAQEAARAVGPLAEWVEPDFPFFSSVLDARDVGEGFPKDNLTSRGLILNLGHNLWACFDTDLLRIACIWQGEEGKPPVTLNALAPGSYHIAGQKTKDGQDDLPKPVGKVWLANGIYPGWQVLKSPDDKPSFTDPREPGPDKAEVGRGPLDAKVGRFIAVEMTERGPVLHYEIGGTEIREWFEVSEAVITRVFFIAPCARPLCFIKGQAPLIGLGLIQLEGEGHLASFLWRKGEIATQTLLPCKSNSRLRVVLNKSPENAISGAIVLSEEPKQEFKTPEKPHWPETITTHATLSQKDDAYVIDDIPLPLPNPWKRNVRLADIAFFPEADGRAAAVTMDGDVWLISGLKDDLSEVKWKRYASGLHEPMSIVIRKSEVGMRNAESNSKKPTDKNSSIPHSEFRIPHSDIFVFDRNGIWKLRDTTGSGEADVYEMFCNRFSQTAETREFPNSMKLAPDGSFVISKGGQQGTTLGKDNGTVIRVAPDGKTYEVLGYGLRQPFVGVHPKTGLITASDQEGNYVPTTPLHIIKGHQFYGHLAAIQPQEKYPQTIADPVTWIPHPVNASGMTQVWLCDAKMGTLNEEMIHLGYNRPEVFRVLMRNRFAKPQAAVVPFSSDLAFPPLNGAVNPADGQLYLTGFQIWGTTARRISGLARIRYTGKKRALLKELTPMDKGVLLRFNEPLDPKLAADPASYSVERWNYKRTFNYGSPHLKLDGTPGQDWMMPSSAYLSKDGLSVFVGIPDMKPVMQMRLGWGLKSADGGNAQNSAYFTPYEFAKFDPEKEGFGDIKVDLTPRKSTQLALAKPTVEEGQRLYQMVGCMACHSIDGTVMGKVGPSWKGLFGSKLTFKDNTTGMADEAYIRESIVDPAAKIVKGYEKLDTGMPIYAGVLNDSQIESLVMFIKTLK